MKSMTPRDRALAAINHKQPDRVPLDIGGTHDTTCHKESLEKLRKFLKIQDTGCLANPWLGSYFLPESIMSLLCSDFRPVYLPIPESETVTLPDGAIRFTDEWNLEWVKRQDSYYFDRIDFLTCETVKDVEKLQMPDDDLKNESWERIQSDLKSQVKFLQKENLFARILDFGVAPLTMTQLFFGFEQSCVNMMLNPSINSALMDKVTELYLYRAESILKKIGKDIDVIYSLADDLGTQSSLWLSVEQYRKLVKPFHKRIIDTIMKFTDAKIMFHSCGKITDFLPDLIDIGIDIINPVQVSADQMDTKKLKNEFGKDIVFWGAIDTQNVLPRGTVKDVEDEVNKRIEDLCIDGGFVVAPVHNIQPDVPPENIVALAKTATQHKLK